MEKRNKKLDAKTHRKWYKRNRKSAIRASCARQVLRNAKLKLEVFTYYCGGTPHCQCPGCPIQALCFLQLDHIKGDGRSHVGENGKRLSGSSLWNFVKKLGYPEDYQVLCGNCNLMKGNKERCPRNGLIH